MGREPGPGGRRHRLRLAAVGARLGARERRKAPRHKKTPEQSEPCSVVEETAKIDISPVMGQNSRVAADPNRSPAKRVRFGSEEQQNERVMSFAMK